MRYGTFVAIFIGVLTMGIGGMRAGATPVAELREKENRVDAITGSHGWESAELGQHFEVRDRVRTGDESRAGLLAGSAKFIRLRSNTLFTVVPPLLAGHELGIELQQGEIYVFSREKVELEVHTPGGVGRPSSTEFIVRVEAGGRSEFIMLEGTLRLTNPQGGIDLDARDDARRAGVATPGQKPFYTARLDAVRARDTVQWCLYYPGVLDLRELGFGRSSGGKIQPAIDAYRSGDLLTALAAWPRGYEPRTQGERLLRAATLLAVGEVDRARAIFSRVPRSVPGRRALERLIAAVQFKAGPTQEFPATASEWLAEAYARQSRGELEEALHAARNAAELSPDFGFAWVRQAELEFSSGRTIRALQLIERAVELSPRNAQAHALHGFLLSAQNRIGAARGSFDRAIELDGALGNAWLGRGLTFIRQGDEEHGRRDLQVAAGVEPNRSIFRSYLGKAFSQNGDAALANLEFARAKQLDWSDPTPWLYSALEQSQENRYNKAIADLEESLLRNENRRLYRSRFLLDQDRAIRGTNLAAIYRNNGMVEQSVREAVSAVRNDYASAPAHLFLANSYDALRDPTRVLLRYETPWFNELLYANLLSPVGGGSLSQFVSEQEYSKLLEEDGPGFNSITEYWSDGRLRERASQFGTSGNVSYAIDGEYYYSDGIRPNNWFSLLESYGSFKLQPGPRDTLFLLLKVQRLDSGNVAQRYNPNDVEDSVALRTYDLSQKETPGLAVLGWHHEWSPNNHTLLLAGKLSSDQSFTVDDFGLRMINRDVRGLVSPEQDAAAGADGFTPDPETLRSLRDVARRGKTIGVFSDLFDLDYQAGFEAYTAEIQQLLVFDRDTVLAGARYQRGLFDTRVRLDDFANGARPDLTPFFGDYPIKQDESVDGERINLYLYNFWRPVDWLTITGGITYDRVRYPENFRNPPINDRTRAIDKTSPKAGVTVQPWRGATMRAAYAESLSGATFDESVRLEPTQVAGFIQSYRSVISESLIGAVAGSEFRITGVSFEQKLPTKTFLGLEYNRIEQKLRREIGSFDLLFANNFLGIAASSIPEDDDYEEEAITGTINQLIGERWSLGAAYRYTRSHLEQRRRGLIGDVGFLIDSNSFNDALRESKQESEGQLHQASIFAVYNHPSGVHVRAEANWYRQANDAIILQGLPADLTARNLEPRLVSQNVGPQGDDFWQFNVIAGYRFARGRCELSAGVLNLTGQDYRLSPLNPYFELPRERTLFVHCKLGF